MSPGPGVRSVCVTPAGTYDLRICCNGVLSGLVTVTCMCGFVDPWAAVVCSGIAGAIYTGVSTLLLRCGIDDPLDSSAVHLGNGLLGTLMLAFVAKPEHVLALTGSPCGGVFYSSTGWLQLGLQLMGECRAADEASSFSESQQACRRHVCWQRIVASSRLCW